MIITITKNDEIQERDGYTIITYMNGFSVAYKSTEYVIVRV